MEYQKMGDHIVVRIDRGDEIIASLKKIMIAENIQTGIVNGIGATNDIELGCYQVAEKTYHSKVHHGEMEIISLAGNMSHMHGEPYLHLHATVAHENGSVYGGHMNYAVISATAELFLTSIDHPLDRQYDDTVGLNTLLFVEQS